MQGDVPLGAGLSSSAAVEMATARALRRGGQSRSESRQNGQARSAGGEQMGRRELRHHGSAYLGRRPGEPRAADRLPLAGDPAGAVSAGHGRGGARHFNPPRPGRFGLQPAAAQCEAAAKFFGVSVLRDVTMEQFREAGPHLDDVTRRRALHVIGENDRTVQAAEAMRRGDAVETGRLMNESHRSLATISKCRAMP